MKFTAIFLAMTLVAPGQEPPVFRSDTRLVEVQVVVTGRGGAPVEGLTEGDFTVLENGKRQKIAFFAGPAARAAVAPPKETLPPGIFTNRPEYTASRPQGVTAIVLDLLNTSIEDQAFMRYELARFLKGLKDDDMVGLYVMSNQLRVIHEFTDDQKSLLKLAGQLRNEWPASNLSREAEIRMAAELFDRLAMGAGAGEASPGGDIGDQPRGGEEMERLMREQRIMGTFGQLELLAQHLAGVPGRKTLVWLGSGMAMSQVFRMGVAKGSAGARTARSRNYANRFERAQSILADANVAVYPVDARGLRVENDAPMYGPLVNRGGRPAFNRMLFEALQAETHSLMNFMAEATGGRAIYNTNDISGGLRRAADDAGANYTLSYYTALDDSAAKRELRVKVNRGGTNVLARRRVPMERRDGLMEIHSLLDSPIVSTGVLVNGRVTRREGELAVMLQIEPGSLLLTRNGAHTEGLVEVYLAQILPSGERRVADALLELRLTEAEVAKVVEQGLVYERTLPLIAEAERLRVVVRDARSGAAGTFDAPVRLMGVD
jgi:VWFA-related protein